MRLHTGCVGGWGSGERPRETVSPPALAVLPRSDGTGRTGGRKHDKRYHLFVLERNTLQAPPFLPISPPTRLLAPLFSRLLPSLLPEPPPASASPVEEPVGPERLGKEQTWAGEAPRKQRHFQ